MTSEITDPVAYDGEQSEDVRRLIESDIFHLSTCPLGKRDPVAYFGGQLVDPRELVEVEKIQLSTWPLRDMPMTRNIIRSIGKSDRLAFFGEQLEVLRRMNESEGFDIGKGNRSVVPFTCDDDSWFRCPHLVDLYANVGLHRYNMLKGTNLRLSREIKFNRTMSCLSVYWITLVATNPDSGCELEFQVKVHESKPHCLALVVSIARPSGEPKSNLEPFSQLSQLSTLEPLPEWPSEDTFNDTKRFYMVKESELLGNTWIRLYLELQVLRGDCVKDPSSLPSLVILKVAIETSNDEEDVVEPPVLNAKNALVYITFRGSTVNGEKAIIRRAYDDRTGCLILLGGFSGDP